MKISEGSRSSWEDVQHVGKLIWKEMKFLDYFEKNHALVEAEFGTERGISVKTKQKINTFYTLLLLWGSA